MCGGCVSVMVVYVWWVSECGGGGGGGVCVVGA